MKYCTICGTNGSSLVTPRFSAFQSAVTEETGAALLSLAFVSLIIIPVTVFERASCHGSSASFFSTDVSFWSFLVPSWLDIDAKRWFTRYPWPVMFVALPVRSTSEWSGGKETWKQRPR